MGALFYVGTLAAVATTSSFIPQVIKINKQGGEDLSYPMLFLYLCGTLLCLACGIILHAAAVVWANAITAILVTLAIALKMTYPLRGPKAYRCPEPHSMAVGQIEHAALWVSDLERARLLRTLVSDILLLRKNLGTSTSTIHCNFGLERGDLCQFEGLYRVNFVGGLRTEGPLR